MNFKNNPQYQYKPYNFYACSLQIVNPLDRVNNFNTIYLEPSQCYRLRPEMEGMIQSRNKSWFLDYSKREYPIDGYVHKQVEENKLGDAFGLLRLMYRQKEGIYKNKLYYREERPSYRHNKIKNNIYDGMRQGAIKRARGRIQTNRQNQAQRRIANAWRNRPRRPALGRPYVGRYTPNNPNGRGQPGRRPRFVQQQYGREQARPAQWD